MKIKTSKCVSGRRKISDLLSEKRVVYICLADDKTGDAFMKNAEEEGFLFADGVCLRKENLMVLWLFAMINPFVM